MEGNTDALNRLKQTRLKHFAYLAKMMDENDPTYYEDDSSWI
jgi:hypothetical protein